MRTALVTGASGFVGGWLCRSLLADGWTVHGTTMHERDRSPTDGLGAVVWHVGDLASGEDVDVVRRAVDAAAPDVVFHLAGLSFVPAAGDDPVSALAVNAGVGVRVLEAVRRSGAESQRFPRTLFVGSAEQYGRHDLKDLPLTEKSSMLARTFYGVTKLAQEEFGFMYHRTYGLPVVATRSFNHSGPGHDSRFLLPALVARIREATRVGSDVIRIGNASAVRDYLHVKDVVRAYRMLAASGEPGQAYNVCSGQGVSVGQLAAEVLAAAGSSASVQRDPALERTIDVEALIGDNAKLRAATGWSPECSRTDIISDLLDAAS